MYEIFKKKTPSAVQSTFSWFQVGFRGSEMEKKTKDLEIQGQEWAGTYPPPLDHAHIWKKLNDQTIPNLSVHFSTPGQNMT